MRLYSCLRQMAILFHHLCGQFKKFDSQPFHMTALISTVGIRMGEKLKEIERGAEEIIENFIKSVETLPELKETYYSQEAYNIMRPDGDPTQETERSEFRKRFISNMPSTDDRGNLKVEVARWTKER